MRVPLICPGLQVPYLDQHGNRCVEYATARRYRGDDERPRPDAAVRSRHTQRLPQNGSSEHTGNSVKVLPYGLVYTIQHGIHDLCELTVGSCRIAGVNQQCVEHEKHNGLGNK